MKFGPAEDESWGWWIPYAVLRLIVVVLIAFGLMYLGERIGL